MLKMYKSISLVQKLELQDVSQAMGLTLNKAHSTLSVQKLKSKLKKVVNIKNKKGSYVHKLYLHIVIINWNKKRTITIQ